MKGETLIGIAAPKGNPIATPAGKIVALQGIAGLREAVDVFIEFERLEHETMVRTGIRWCRAALRYRGSSGRFSRRPEAQ